MHSGSVEQWMMEGHELASVGSYREAVERYRAAVTAAPTNEPALLGLGGASLCAGDVELARLSLEKLLTISRNHIGVVAELAKDQRERGNNAAAFVIAASALPWATDTSDRADLLWTLTLCRVAEKRHGEAREHAEQVMALEPEHPGANRYLAWHFYRAAEWGRALKSLRVATSSWPDDARLWADLAEAGHNAGEANESRDAALRAAALWKGDDAALGDRITWLLLIANEFEQTRLVGTRTLQLKPPRERQALLHWMIGDACSRAGAAGRALSHHRKAYRLQPEDPEISYAIGLDHSRLNNPAAAERWYRRAAKLDAGCARYWEAIGIAAAELGRLRAAERAFRVAVVLDPQDPDCLLGLANVVMRLGREREAGDLARQLLAREPDHPRALYMLGEAHRLCGELDAALIQFERAAAVSQEPGLRVGLALAHLDRKDYPRAEAILSSMSGAQRHRTALLVEALAAQGRREEALDLAKSATKLQPDESLTWVALANARRAAGDHEGAAEAGARARTLGPRDPWVSSLLERPSTAPPRATPTPTATAPK